MKNLLITAIAALSSAVCLTACGQTRKENNMSRNEDIKEKKVLVAFFSRTGENYGVGNIKKGNTHIVAELIAQETGGELFEIEPVKPYPDGYERCTEVAQDEKNANARPAVKSIKDVSGYDIVFIGYPIWWGDAPMPVYTWIEANGWQGKTVIPFCTHEGSGLGATESYMAEACEGAEVKRGLAMTGTTAQRQPDKAQKTVEKWLQSIGF